MKELKLYILGNEQLSIHKQCELLDLSRSSVYHEAIREGEDNLWFMWIMDEEYLENAPHRVLQMQDFLFISEFLINHKWVRRLLLKMGIKAIYLLRNLSRLVNVKYVKSYFCTICQSQNQIRFSPWTSLTYQCKRGLCT